MSTSSMYCSGSIPILPLTSISSRPGCGNSTSLPLRYAPILIASVTNAADCSPLRNLRREQEHERRRAESERDRHDAPRDLLRADLGIDSHIGGLRQERKP